LGISKPPTRWADLADPRYLHEIALANPVQSGSVGKSFEMVIQQQIQEAVATPDQDAAPASDEAIAAGWTRAMQLLQKIGANARYFTDASTKISLDVASGECAAGMTIDFYGRYQSQAVADANGESYVHYVDAVGGTSFGVDPIGVYRGAPHPDLAREFVEFVLSPTGQKLWNWKVGAPDGPERYALRRQPILPSLYDAKWNSFRSDPDVMPYEAARKFTYHPEWTGPLFGTISFIFRSMCIDPHQEQVRAWSAIIEAGMPPEALAEFSKVDAVDYATAQGRIRSALGGAKIREVELARELADHFRGQYRRAEALARAGR
ncbi:MAG: extracellular solute-binding protein, partial [Chthoniobacteraceae bacterium]